jgi:Fic family protein
MKLTKTSSYVLLNLLNGSLTASTINSHMPELSIRTIQRILNRFVEAGLVIRQGPRNNPSFVLDYDTLLRSEIPVKVLENENRPETGFHFDLVTWLQSAQLTNLASEFGLPREVATNPLTSKELEYLTIELSWKSSALEGNTYTLLDTQLLLTEGLKAKNRTQFETQMILNHKNAIAFITDNPELFRGDLKFASVETLHNIIGDNLGIDKGIRNKLTRISASNYVPLSNPHQLRENADRVLGIINRQANPYVKSLLALSLVPYLQAFEDGNKRTGRILANAILISQANIGFSLRKVDAKELALAYLAFYEFNSLQHLANILRSELSR